MRLLEIAIGIVGIILGFGLGIPLTYWFCYKDKIRIRPIIDECDSEFDKEIENISEAFKNLRICNILEDEDLMEKYKNDPHIYEITIPKGE